MAGTAFAVAETQTSEWLRAHEALSRLATERAAADAEEGRWLLAALRSATHVHLGFGSFVEYIERLFGYKPRSTQEKLRVAEALEGLPAMRRALEEGALSWSAVRELTRVAVQQTEREWLELAYGKTIRQLEEVVAGKSLGDTPTTPFQPEAQRHVLRFEVAVETFATFREAVRELRRGRDSSLDDDSVLLAMARHVLGGPRDTGRASYQVTINLCAVCGTGHQQADGVLVPVGAEIVEMARCDGQLLGKVAAPAANETSAVGGARVAVYQPQLAGAHVGARGGGTNDPARAHVGARAKQDIPPAMRRAVILRDREHCRAPGCKNATFLDLHHLEPRSKGGRNHADNLVTLCSVHHRAAHRGELVIDGQVATNVRFHHADGSEYGHLPKPKVLEAQRKTLAVLRGLGFREREARRVITELSAQPELRGESAERLLREALARLTPACPTSSD